MPNKLNRYETYIQEKLKDPHFVAYYTLAKEKLDLDLLLETMQYHIEQSKDKSILLDDLKSIQERIRGILKPFYNQKLK